MTYRKFLNDAIELPTVFQEAILNSELHSVYVASCETSRLVYIDESFERLTGYSQEDMDGGLDFWLSLIHPEDKPRFMDSVLAGHRKMLSQDSENESPELFFNLEYRVRKRNGEWIWIQEMKVLQLSGGRIDKVLGLLIDIHAQRVERDSTKSAVPPNVISSRLLDIAIQFKKSGEKFWIHKPVEETVSRAPMGIGFLTKREKEVLQLVGEGFSTKQIADKLNISFHTVETHRRHLLEKMQVKNSMELIKEASKAFLF